LFDMPNPIYLRKNKSTSENESKLGKLKKWLTSQLVFKWECIFYLVKLAIEMLVVVVLARIHFSKTRVWARFNEESYSDLIWHCPTHTHTHTHIYIYIYIFERKLVYSAFIFLFCYIPLLITIFSAKLPPRRHHHMSKLLMVMV